VCVRVCGTKSEQEHDALDRGLCLPELVRTVLVVVPETKAVVLLNLALGGEVVSSEELEEGRLAHTVVTHDCNAWNMYTHARTRTGGRAIESASKWMGERVRVRTVCRGWHAPCSITRYQPTQPRSPDKRSRQHPTPAPRSEQGSHSFVETSKKCAHAVSTQARSVPTGSTQSAQYIYIRHKQAVLMTQARGWGHDASKRVGARRTALHVNTKLETCEQPLSIISVSEPHVVHAEDWRGDLGR
jgi:hypothetical protein